MSLQINLLKKLRLKRIMVILLVTAGIAGEALPETAAKMLTLPCLAGAVAVEAIIGE